MEPRRPSTRAAQSMPPPPPPTASSLPWQILAAVALSVSFIILLVVGYSVMSRDQVAARDRLELTVAADHALDRLQALMVDAETAVRGFALVNRQTMLEPYHNAKAQYAGMLADVGKLTADDKTQQESFEVLRGLVADKWAILDASVERESKSDMARSAATESTEDTPGKLVMDAIRHQVAAMHVRESVIREHLAEAFQRAVSYTRSSVLLASFLALFAIFALYWATRRYFYLRLQVEAQLRASEERYRTLTDVSPQIIWMADLSGEMTYCNRQWVEYTGLDLEQSIAAGAASVVHADDRGDVTAAWERAIARNQPFESEVRLRRARDGNYRWHLARARPMHDVDGTALMWLGAAVDIDDRKMVEIALDQLNATLAEQVEERTADLEKRSAQLKELNTHLIRVAESERSRLARELHDELGAHLSVAMMDLTVISRRLEETGATDVVSLTRRLAETLTATTQISRRIISDLRPVMIRELGLAGALDVYCEQFEKTTSIRCERVFPDSLPPIVDEAGIALFRIVQESLSNVVKYAAASVVQLSMGVNQESIELSIQDDGKGMTDDAHTKKGTHGLLGIRERAEAFDGTLRLTKGLRGRGVGIVVTLPLVEIAGPAAANVASAVPTAVATGR
jgi:PAS domain S-box-containing protein